MTLVAFGASADAAGSLSPSEEMDQIFKKIPAQWWWGGWDHRKEIDGMVSKYPSRTDLYCRRILYYGDYYYSNNQYDSAIEHYQKLIRDHPGDTATPTALRHLADLYSYRMNRYGDATRLYTQVIEKYPSSADTPAAEWRLKQIRLDAEYEQARGWLEKGFAEAGLELYYRLIEEYGKDTSTEWPAVARMDLAEHFRSTGDLIQARKELQHVMDDYPRSTYIPSVKKLLDSREYLLDSKEPPKRMDYLVRKYLKSPGRFERLDCLPGDFRNRLREAKTEDDAVQAVMKHANIDTPGPARQFLQGLLEFEYGDEGEGLFLMREVSRASGQNIVLGEIMACLAYDLSDVRGWDEDRERKLLYIRKITPAAVARYWSGRVYVDGGFYAEALDAFRPLLSDSSAPNDVPFYYAVSLHETGEADNALKRLRALPDSLTLDRPARAMRGKLRDVYCHIGGSFETRGDSSSAVRYYRSGGCHGELGDLYFNTDDWFEAAVELEEADWNYDWGKYRNRQMRLAESYERLGSVENAFEVISRAAKGCQREPGLECVKILARLAELKLKVSTAAPDIEKDFPGLEARLRLPRFQFFKEKSLPAGASLPKTARLVEPDSPELESLKDREIVFSARDGNRILAVSSSGALDPRASISNGGYFAHLSFDGGEHWTLPLYMGFAEGFPYVIGTDEPSVREEEAPRRKGRIRHAPAGQRPLRIAPFKDGNIQIEVRVREVDESTITFPAMRLQAKRVQDGVYLVFPIEALTRDLDKDGLTDLHEEKTAADPFSADTDKDGVSDSIDVQPLSPPDAERDDDGFMRAALDHILFHRRGRRPWRHPDTSPPQPDTTGPAERPFNPERVLFIESNRPLSVTSHFPMRIIAVPSTAMDLYRKKFGATYMLRYTAPVFNKDRTEAFLKYDFHWRGGSLRAKKVKGAWQIEGIREWIT